MQKQLSQICGECNKPFTQTCMTTRFCDVHNQDCFSCITCSEEEDKKKHISVCEKCHKISPVQNMFYDYQCDAFFCPQQFLEISIGKQIQIPCCQKHKIDVTQFLQYMSQYCYKCTRKITKIETQKRQASVKGDRFQFNLKLCGICHKQIGEGFISNINQKIQVDLYLNQKQIMIQRKKSKDFGKKQNQLEKVSNKLIQSKQKQRKQTTTKQTLKQLFVLQFNKEVRNEHLPGSSKESQEQQNKANKLPKLSMNEVIRGRQQMPTIQYNSPDSLKIKQFEKKIDQKNHIVSILEQDIMNLRQVALILENQVHDLNQIIKKQNQRSKFLKKQLDEHCEQCINCCLQFDLEKHMPMQICLRQHILCKQCLQKYKQSNHLDCPCCSDKIIYQKILPSRSILLIMNCSKILKKDSNYAQAQSITQQKPQAQQDKPQKTARKEELKDKQSQILFQKQNQKKSLDKPSYLPTSLEKQEKKIKRKYQKKSQKSEKELSNNKGRKKVKTNPQYNAQLPKNSSDKDDEDNKNAKNQALPKKPLSAYMIYFQQKKQNFVQKHKSLNSSDMVKTIAQEWNQLTQLEKQPYLDKASEYRKNYTQKKANY